MAPLIPSPKRSQALRARKGIARRLLLAALAALVVSTGVAANGASAHSTDTFASTLNRNASVYWCATQGVAVCSSPMNGMPAGSRLQMNCWVSGNPGVNGDQKWFYVKFQNGALRGFVSAPAVSSQTSTPNCYWQKDTALMLVALNHVGQVWASGTDATYFSASEWSPGPVNEWSGDCPKLPYVVYKALNITILKYDAITNYNKYAAAGQMRTSGEPPLGAVVFYAKSASNGWKGHEAIYIGDGRTASTQGLDNQYLPNSLGYLSGSIGYVQP